MFMFMLGCALFAGSWCSSWQSGIAVADPAILFFTQVRDSGARKAGCTFQHLKWLFQVKFAAYRGLSGLTCHHLCIFNQFLLALKLLKGSVLQGFIKLCTQFIQVANWPCSLILLPGQQTTQKLGGFSSAS